MGKENIERLIKDLANFRTRARARAALVDMGAEAVEPLIEALSSNREAVLWAVIQSLGDIGDERAIEPLVGLLEKGRMNEAAARSLAKITNQNLGEDPAAWRKWLEEKTGEVKAAPRPEVPATEEELLTQVVAGTPLRYTKTPEGGYQIVVPVEEGRSQVVKILFGSKDAEGEELVVVYTECGPATEKNYEWALRQNLRMSYGAVALRVAEDKKTFVMVNTHLRRMAEAEEVKKSVFTLAQRADAVEKALTKRDEL
jgi:hypothetical protein